MWSSIGGQKNGNPVTSQPAANPPPTAAKPLIRQAGSAGAETRSPDRRRLAGNLRHFNLSVPQRILRLRRSTGLIILGHVLHDPFVEEGLALDARHKSANLVPHDGLQIMGETGDRQHVRELGGQARIGVRFGLVVFLRFVGGLYTEESGVIGALTMDKRNR